MRCTEHLLREVNKFATEIECPSAEPGSLKRITTIIQLDLKNAFGRINHDIALEAITKDMSGTIKKIISKFLGRKCIFRDRQGFFHVQ